MTEPMKEEGAMVVNVDWKHGGEYRREQAQEVKALSPGTRLGCREVLLLIINLLVIFDFLNYVHALRY